MKTRSIVQRTFLLSVLGSSLLAAEAQRQEPIPLPEHPRPDFQRADWQNLNGPWHFRFDKENSGEKEKWFEGKADAPLSTAFPLTITVPFPWGSKLSGVGNEADIGWYARTVRIRIVARPARRADPRRMRLAHHGVARRPGGGCASRLHAGRV